MRRHLRAGPKLIGAARGDQLSLVQVSEYFNKVTRSCSRSYVHPFDAIVADSEDKCALQIAGQRRAWYK